MRYIYFTLLTLLSLSVSAAIQSSDFPRTSRLASGKWVKIGVVEDGIYEISYETLRNMGFSNPEKVGVYGRGGHMMPRDYSSITGQVEFQDDLPPVPIFRMNDKIYFYGQGTLELKFERNLLKYDGGGAFSRSNNNIYSTEGYYFLSDRYTPLMMEKVSAVIPSTPVKECKKGVGVVTHEVDMLFNPFNTGQLYFGERMTPENPRIEFNLSLPDAIAGGKGAIECVTYTDKIRDIIGKYGFKDADEVFETKDLLVSSSDFTPHSPTQSVIVIPSENPTFYNELDFSANDGKEMTVSNLDYWVLSYPKNIPSLKDPSGKDIAQDRIALPAIYYPNTGMINIPDALNRIVFDISNPSEPKYLEITTDSPDRLLYLKPGIQPLQIAIMNPLKEQKQPRTVTLSDPNITNQDIHAKAVDGADLIIVCIPKLKTAAEKLADLHRRYMNQRVIVATTEECYNEFSNGMPDPQAIRSLVKMAHLSSYGCKNLLLMGPLFADFRGITMDKNPLEGIIAYQSPSINSERGGFNANDFFGITIDNMGNYSIEELPVTVGVGILPIRYEAEADIYLEKVENYITRTDFAYYLNHMASFGGVGDSDLHSAQVPEMDRYLNSLGNRSMINSQVLVDAYGYQEAHDKLFRLADEGALMFTYYGHGNPVILNHSGNFFIASDVYNFRNSFLPFWGFAGCELTEPDKGHRGMGESVVVSTPYGMIGTLLATRDTWSSMNLDLFKKFFANFMREGGNATAPFHKDARTIGEIYANTKTQSKYSNEMAYQLVCDPAIVIPQVNRKIALDNDWILAPAGEWLELTGYVVAHKSTDVDTDFNGEVVVRLMEPTRQEPCPHVVAKVDPSIGFPDRDVYVTYADTQVAMGVGKVENGRFSLKVMIPQDVEDFTQNEGRLHVAAYDPSSRQGAAVMSYVNYRPAPAEGSTLSADTKSPVIEIFEYLPASKSLNIRISDDTALAYETNSFSNPFKLLIDGKEYRSGRSTQPMLDYENNAYTKSIDISNISLGQHSAKIIVKDAAGNEAVAELVFNNLSNSEKFAISLKDGVVDKEGIFEIIGEVPAEADLVIIDANGMLVSRSKLQTGEFRWDATDLEGHPVAPGLYKAYLIETGTKCDKGHSPIINVPVI